MTEFITSFEQLLDPVAPETFFADFHHQKPLHVSGGPDKFASVMSWDALNRMLEMDVWTPQSLKLYLDAQQVPPGGYCRRTVNRNWQQVMQPDAEMVAAMIRRGASLLLDQVETLHSGVLSVVNTLQDRLGAKCSANLYFSCNARRAFDSHCDRHDAYALQIYGSKRWCIYEGRADNPIEHELFKNVPQIEYDRMKGRVAEELEMQPGDLLYLPRGQFHDALASSEISVHVTFGCTEPIGLDWLTQLWNCAVQESVFRTELPDADADDGEEALKAHLHDLFDRLRKIAVDQRGLELARSLRKNNRIKHGGYDFPDVGRTPGSGVDKTGQ